MAETIVNALIVLIILGMTYALMSEGAWGAALMFFSVLFAGLIAFNFYEPLAALLAEKVEALSGFADALCMMALFVVSLTLLRLTTETLGPAMVRLPTPLYHLGRLGFGLGASLITMAIIILAFEASPVHKKVMGAVTYDSQPPFGQGLDRAWLAFFQYTTGYVFADYSGEDRDTEFNSAKAFDPQGDWLIREQNARPYGDEVVPPPEGNGGEAPAEDGASPEPSDTGVAPT